MLSKTTAQYFLIIETIPSGSIGKEFMALHQPSCRSGRIVTHRHILPS